jgi:transposase
MEDWVTIKNLKSKKPGMGTRKIADLLGISRNTVRRALKSNLGPEYKRILKPNPDLEPFYDLINQYYWQKRYKGSRILSEIKSKGYKGSQSAFYRYFSKIRNKVTKSYHPYETGPGEQAQFDWSPYTVWIENLRTRVYVYGYILGFSRRIIFEASLSVHQGSVFEALENSFAESGGVPEMVQTDNAACFVTNASKEQFQWNSRYLTFCGHYGFKPTRSLPGHPWSKGKVEKPFSYLETHFIQGGQFESFEDFYTRLKEFQDTYNQRIHSVTKTAPEELFNKEKESLSPLPAMRYVSVKEEVRKVTADCLISFNGNRYSVPWMFATKMVWIKVSKGYFLEIYSQSNKLIARHKMSLEKGQIIMLNEHYRGNKNDHGNWKRLVTMFNQRYPNKTVFLDKLQAQKRINARYHLGRILEIGSYYKPHQVTQAISAALEYNVFNFYFFQGYLENHFQHDIQIPEAMPVRHTYFQDTSLIRDLNTYALKDGGGYEA